MKTPTKYVTMPRFLVKGVEYCHAPIMWVIHKVKPSNYQKKKCFIPCDVDFSRVYLIKDVALSHRLRCKSELLQSASLWAFLTKVCIPGFVHHHHGAGDRFHAPATAKNLVQLGKLSINIMMYMYVRIDLRVNSFQHTNHIIICSTLHLVWEVAALILKLQTWHLNSDWSTWTLTNDVIRLLMTAGQNVRNVIIFVNAITGDCRHRQWQIESR